jgi:DNA-binding MarR family transcriptional regulator
MVTEGADGDHPVLQACRDLAAAMDLFDEAACAVLGIGRSDLRALTLLGDEALTATALSRALGLTRPAVTALVDRLVAADFVERVAVPGDRRATAVSVRPGTDDVLTKVYGPLRQRVGTVVDGLPAAEQAAVSAALDVLAGAFRAAGADLDDEASGPASDPGGAP